MFVKEMVPIIANNGYKGKEMMKKISEPWRVKIVRDNKMLF